MRHLLLLAACLALWPVEAGAQKYRARTQEEVSGLADAVRGVLGLDARRGDRLHVSVLPFASGRLRAQAERKRRAEERDELVQAVLLNMAKAVAIVLALLVLRTVVGAIGRGVAREEELVLAVQREVVDEVAEEVPETQHDVLLGRIAQLIAENPEGSARVVRTMLIGSRQ